MSNPKIELLAPIVKSLRRDVTAIKYWHRGDKRWTTAACKHEPMTTELLALHARTSESDCPEGLRNHAARGMYFLGAGESAEQIAAHGSKVVKAACFDLDDKEKTLGIEAVMRTAKLLSSIAARRGLEASIWMSSGGSGAHVWFRWAEPQCAYSVRAAMSDILDGAGLKSGAKAGLEGGEVEIFPKQDAIAPGQIGNMVILPGALLSRYITFHAGGWKGLTLDDMVEAGMQDVFPLSEPVPVLERPYSGTAVSVRAGVRPVGLDLADLWGDVVSEAEKEMREILDHVPRGLWDDHDQWVRLGCSLLNWDAEVGAKLWHEYSAQSFKYDYDYTEYKIDNLLRSSEARILAGQNVLGMGSLRRIAAANGWSDAKAEDFDNLDVELDPAFDPETGEVLEQGDSPDTLGITDDCGGKLTKLDSFGRPAAKGLSMALANLPWLMRDNKGKIEPITDNLLAVLSSPEILGGRIIHDRFTDQVMVKNLGKPSDGDVCIGEWRPLRDVDYTAIKSYLENFGKAFKPINRLELRECIYRVASNNPHDTAIEWLEGLQWDGIPRVSRFIRDYMAGRDHVSDEDRDISGGVDAMGDHGPLYEQAVSEYMWSALAARILDPGCKVEMAPIFVGSMGARKSSAVTAMAPGGDNGGMYGIFKLNDKDDDISRKLRGVLIAELEELEGLASTSHETIRTLLSRQWEKWIPKYKEMATRFPRRSLFIGTCNGDDFLGDPHGHRRWLPMFVGEEAKRLDGLKFCDSEAITRDREQLWAEGREIYKARGILFAEAERLAKFQHRKFVFEHPFKERVMLWIKDYLEVVKAGKSGDDYDLTSDGILAGIGITGKPSTLEYKQVRKVMEELGFEKKQVRLGDYRYNVWVKPGEGKVAA